MEDEIKTVEPKGLIRYPVKEDIPSTSKLMYYDLKVAINDRVPWSSLLTLWAKESLITSILTMKGGNMNNDTKATATSIATGVIALAGLFGFGWSIEAVTGIITVGIMVLGYFTNKKDVVK